MDGVLFSCDGDLSKYTDSLLFSSGKEIAKLCYKDVTVTLGVCGEVSIEYDGVEYKDVSEYPDKLKDIISNSTDDSEFETNGVLVRSCNWLEYYYELNDTKETASYEWDIQKRSHSYLLGKMIDIAEYAIKYEKGEIPE